MSNHNDRFDAIVHYAIIVYPQNSIHHSVLQTTLWLADIVHSKSFSISVTWADRYSLIDGIPTSELLSGSLERLKADGRIRETRRIFSRSSGVHYQSTVCPNVNYVSPRSLQTIHDVTRALRCASARGVLQASVNAIWSDWPHPADVPLQLAAGLAVADAQTINHSNWAVLTIGEPAAAFGDSNVHHFDHPGPTAVGLDH